MRAYSRAAKYFDKHELDDATAVDNNLKNKETSVVQNSHSLVSDTPNLSTQSKALTQRGNLLPLVRHTPIIEIFSPDQRLVFSIERAVSVGHPEE